MQPSLDSGCNTWQSNRNPASLQHQYAPREFTVELTGLPQTAAAFEACVGEKKCRMGGRGGEEGLRKGKVGAGYRLAWYQEGVASGGGIL